MTKTNAAERRVIQNHHIDSTRWDDFPLRGDDIIISTYAKAGTTWLQQIVGQLVFNGAADIHYGLPLSPWLDMRLIPKDELFPALAGQQHRRFIKSHLPFDALPNAPGVKYLYVARDARDVLWSLYTFHGSFTPLYVDLLNNTPGRVGPELCDRDPDIVRYYRTWITQDGAPFWAFWSHIRSWWEVRDDPQVMLIHYNQLKAHMTGEIRRIAQFLGIEIDEAAWPRIVEHCSFEWMKRVAQEAPPTMANDILDGGIGALVNKGTNGRWKDVLCAEDVALADQVAAQHLPQECVHWLRTGELPA